ncbi:MAG: peptidoglycan DD-metalloendopeptidase family protein [Rickettsiales bacterium]|jgi:murein DD-endopeptidase MepM/ murein hydrolase activator NlpD|nr:peptidoglycan DD-metalloendopeptidase family protein [Rickettsiales bacterium]
MYLFAKFSSFLSMLTAPFRWAWRQICHIFPERDFTIMTTPSGLVRSFHQTSFWRFSRACFWMGLSVWAFWSTYIYVYHRPMLQQRTAELEAMRAQHATQMSDLVSYHKKFVELQRDMTSIDNQILEAKKMGEAASADLLKRRLNTWVQVDFLQQKLDEIYTNGSYAPEVKKFSELQLDYELVKEENRQVRKWNKELEDSMIAVKSADFQIVERVSALTANGIEAINKDLRKIGSTLASLGLDDQKLAEKANKSESPAIGEPVKDFNLAKNIDPKYEELARQVQLWQGLERTKTMLPLGVPLKGKTRLTSHYGVRSDPFDGIPTMHKGIDFSGQIGTPLYAVAPGKVIQAGDRFGYGTSVEIDNGLGFTTLYAHLSEKFVNRGDWVKVNDIIGLGGSSGRSTGPHLHYEIRYNGAPFNPYTFIKAKE